MLYPAMVRIIWPFHSLGLTMRSSAQCEYGILQPLLAVFAEGTYCIRELAAKSQQLTPAEIRSKFLPHCALSNMPDLPLADAFNISEVTEKLSGQCPHSAK